MTSQQISPPDFGRLVTPLLSALPGASVSTQPPSTVLPLLSPILRQRVKLMSEASQEPWIRLLTYDTAKVSKLTSIAQSGSLEPHPVSGEIELDWDYNVEIRYKRLDEETLQTLVVIEDFDLFVRLVYCINDADGEGGPSGWRVGEVGTASNPSPLTAFGGFRELSEAETTFAATKAGGIRQPSTNGTRGVAVAVNTKVADHQEGEDDDDDYWARYDATPARTPAVKQSPAPQSMRPGQPEIERTQSAEDAYYAQYDDVQPAMDPHDPDEEAEHIETAPPLGLGRPAGSRDSGGLNETTGSWTLEPPKSPSVHSTRSQEDEERSANLLHPRPASSASSNGSLTVAKLEESAERREQSEFGVKQHVSRSIRSLFLLSRSAGIDREEFERMVKTELDVLSMVEDDI
ncbi:hypothetical protein QBC40DRAFT_271535 [Triangularia verruculosa]|uniref:Uncharacterized protein n=1 Tax=Triangularia verruculosa TaxID=2587418 RepID=A0AAN6XVJ7_9PEZI|nr:hypothetical protein QBC40DRAFT_271535 [Triangularia verruculosa]